VATLLDNANRANETPLNNGGAWKGPVFNGDKQVALTSERFANSENAWSNSYWATKFAANQVVRVTVAATTTSRTFELTARIQNPGLSTLNCYYLAVTTAGAWELGSVKAGVEATVGTGTKTIAVGDKLWLECNGTTIKCVHETAAGVKTTVIEKTNSTVSGEGFIGCAGSGTGIAWDDFYGGALTEDVTVAAPTAVAILSASAAVPTINLSAPSGAIAAAASAPTPSASITTTAGGASASGVGPALGVTVTAASAGATAGADPPTPGATVSLPAGSASAGAAPPAASIGLQSPAAVAVVSAAAAGINLTVVAPSAVILAAMPVPEVVIGDREAPLSDLPTKLTLSGAPTSLVASVSASALMVEGPSTGLELEGGVSNTLTTEGPTSDLAPESPSSRLVPDAPSTELGLDG